MLFTEQRVADMLMLERVKKFYIGKASGRGCYEALVRRDDRVKQENGLNLMMAIYRSRSRDVIDVVEKRLIDVFSRDKRCLNERSGGGGRPSTAPEYYVYLACRLWKAPELGEFDDEND